MFERSFADHQKMLVHEFGMKMSGVHMQTHQGCFAEFDIGYHTVKPHVSEYVIFVMQFAISLHPIEYSLYAIVIGKHRKLQVHFRPPVEVRGSIMFFVVSPPRPSAEHFLDQLVIIAGADIELESCIKLRCRLSPMAWAWLYCSTRSTI